MAAYHWLTSVTSGSRHQSLLSLLPTFYLEQVTTSISYVGLFLPIHEHRTKGKLALDVVCLLLCDSSQFINLSL